MYIIKITRLEGVFIWACPRMLFVILNLFQDLRGRALRCKSSPNVSFRVSEESLLRLWAFHCNRSREDKIA